MFCRTIEREGRIVGFEFGDDDTVVPVTCWIHSEGEVPELSSGGGDEVFVYGYISINQKDSSIVVNGNGIFKA